MGNILQDLRYGLRTLARSPGFSLVAVLTIALGIGANTAIFTVVNAVLLSPLPYPDPYSLVSVYERTADGGYNAFSTSYFLAWHDQVKSFEEFAAFRPAAFNVGGGDKTERVIGANVSASIFSLLGISPILGRTFTPDEDRPGGGRVVVLSYGFWQTRFGGDPNVIGKSLALNGDSYTIIGVMPRGYDLPQRKSDLYGALQLNPAEVNGTGRGIHWLFGLAKLKPGTSLDQAQNEIANLAHGIGQQYPHSDAGLGLLPIPLIEDVVGGVRPVLWILLAAVGLVLLIACVNVANLLLARASVRQREMALRAALGASRGRLTRQLLTESTLLALIGGSLGLLLAYQSLPMLVSLAPAASIPRAEAIGLNSSVLYFTILMTLLTGLIFGIVPSLQASKVDLIEALKQAGRAGGSSAGHRRMRSALVIAEITLAVMLLIGAGLLVRSFISLRQVKPGFDPKHVLSMRISVPATKLSNEQSTAFQREVIERVSGLPGVTSAALTRDMPFGGVDPSLFFTIEGRPPVEPGKEPIARWRMATPGFFKTMDVPLLRGRDFTGQDSPTSADVVIISAAMAKQYWPNEDPVGKQIHPGYPNAPMTCTIVGVVGDVRQWLSIDEPPTAYYPYAQIPPSLGPIIFGTTTLAVRTAGDPASLAPAIRETILDINSDAPVFQVETMETLMSIGAASTRFQMVLLGIFAGIGMMLAAVGIYGLISYSVTQRTREIGIRMALGAERGDVLRMVVRQGFRLSLIGVAAGIAAALALTRVMASRLYGVTPTDLATFGTVPVGLIAVALAASYIPARRATRVDPAVALREE